MFPINNTKFLCPPNPVTGNMWRSFTDLQEDLKSKKPLKIFTYDSTLQNLVVSEIVKLTEHIEYPTSLSDKHTNCFYKYGDLELSGTTKIPMIVFNEPLRPKKINLRELHTEVNIKNNITKNKDYMIPNIIEYHQSDKNIEKIFSDFDYFKLFLYSLGQFNLIERLTSTKYVIYLDKIRKFTNNNEALIGYIINQIKYLNVSNRDNKKTLESIESYEISEDKSKLYFTLAYDGNMDYITDIIGQKKLNLDTKSLCTYAHYFTKNLRSIYISLLGEYKIYSKSSLDIEFIQGMAILSGLVPLNTLRTYYTSNDIDCNYHNYYHIDLTGNKFNGETEPFLSMEMLKQSTLNYVNKKNIEKPIKTGHILTWDQQNSLIVIQNHIPGDGSYSTTGAYLIG